MTMRPRCLQEMKLVQLCNICSLGGTVPLTTHLALLLGDFWVVFCHALFFRLFVLLDWWNVWGTVSIFSTNWRQLNLCHHLMYKQILFSQRISKNLLLKTFSLQQMWPSSSSVEVRDSKKWWTESFHSNNTVVKNHPLKSCYLQYT